MSIDGMCCFYGDQLIYFCLANGIVVEVVGYFCDRHSSCSCWAMIVIDLLIGIVFAVVLAHSSYDHRISLICLVNVFGFVIENGFVVVVVAHCPYDHRISLICLVSVIDLVIWYSYDDDQLIDFGGQIEIAIAIVNVNVKMKHLGYQHHLVMTIVVYLIS